MTDLDRISPIAVGDIVTFPGHQLRVVATEFTRDPAFPDAVARVAVEAGSACDLGTHVSTPFGMVEVVEDDRGLLLD